MKSSSLPTEIRAAILSIDALQLNPWLISTTAEGEPPLYVQIRLALEAFLSEEGASEGDRDVPG